jgi:hypothetical protein
MRRYDGYRSLLIDDPGVGQRGSDVLVAIAEYVDLKNTFYGTNGITIQTVFDLDGGLIARDTDYWDSRELGESDIVGPADTTDDEAEPTDLDALVEILIQDRSLVDEGVHIECIFGKELGNLVDGAVTQRVMEFRPDRTGGLYSSRPLPGAHSAHVREVRHLPNEHDAVERRRVAARRSGRRRATDFEFQSWLLRLGVRYLTGGFDVGYIPSAGRADVKQLRELKL